MDKIQIYVFDTRRHTYNELLRYVNLGPKDVSELERFRVLDVRKEKLVSLYFKKKYVGEYTHNEYGKPISSSFYFNISHSKGVVVLAKSQTLDLGIDVEVLREKDEDLVKYVCNEEEYKFVKNEYDFLSVWTNKESIVKCLGTGIKKNVKSIPSLPLCGKKEYEGVFFFSKIIKHSDVIISVTVKGDQDFAYELIAEDVNQDEKVIIE